eukprot:m.208591 g.208591  ORF g.208591 m.208591 type:complete len:54 (-) comp24182_c0_seq1:106-267(-)
MWHVDSTNHRAAIVLCWSLALLDMHVPLSLSWSLPLKRHVYVTRRKSPNLAHQ